MRYERGPYFMLLIIVLFFAACKKPTVKTGYVKVPTVTENARSGVFNILEPTSPAVRLYYEECGQGEPLILLHEHAVDCRMWDDVFFSLAGHFRVIRYDLRGYGRSGMPETGYGYLDADDLKNLMDALGIKKAHLAGVSLGGTVVTDFLAIYSDRVLSATISSGALIESPDRSMLPKRLLKLYNDTIYALKNEQAHKNRIRGIQTIRDERKAIFKSVCGRHYRDVAEQINRMVDDWSGWQEMNPSVDAFLGNQAIGLLTRKKKRPRILLLIGQHDADANKKSMQRMAALCPGATIHFMKESGRFTCMESPEEFMDCLVQLIRKK